MQWVQLTCPRTSVDVIDDSRTRGQSCGERPLLRDLRRPLNWSTGEEELCEAKHAS